MTNKKMSFEEYINSQAQVVNVEVKNGVEYTTYKTNDNNVEVIEVF